MNVTDVAITTYHQPVYGRKESLQNLVYDERMETRIPFPASGGASAQALFLAKMNECGSLLLFVAKIASSTSPNP